MTGIIHGYNKYICYAQLVDLGYWWIMLDNIWINQMAANLWILWIITHSSKASIKWWPIDGSINCPAQSMDCPDPSIVHDI